MTTTVVTSEAPSGAATEAMPVASAQTNENDVAIAAIEADKQVQIAQIDAEARVATEQSYNEARVAVAEAEASAPEEGTMEWRMSRLEQTAAEIQNSLATLIASQAQPVSSPQVTEEIAEAVSETLEATNLTPQSTSQETSSTQTEATEESAESAALIPPLVEVTGKPIIRLV